jgi:hypothetical protein
MNSRVYPKNIFTREVNRIQIGRLHCPKCLSNDVYSNLNDVCACRDCYSKSDFKELLNKEQVRERKIINILS